MARTVTDSYPDFVRIILIHPSSRTAGYSRIAFYETGYVLKKCNFNKFRKKFILI
jgi:hypothetical protein